MPAFLNDIAQNHSVVFALIQLSLAFVMASVLRVVYIKYGTSISNRRAFSVNFFLLAMTITFIITIVKSSLALSLGLVGALSIVRFRSAIKEPEELAYLFITIAIGIGLGANQVVLTSVAFVIIVIAIIITSTMRKGKEEGTHANLSIILRDCEEPPTMSSILEVIKPHCNQHIVRRYLHNDNTLDAGIVVELKSESAIDAVKEGLKQLNPNIQMNYLNPQSLAL